MRNPYYWCRGEKRTSESQADVREAFTTGDGALRALALAAHGRARRRAHGAQRLLAAARELCDGDMTRGAIDARRIVTMVINMIPCEDLPSRRSNTALVPPGAKFAAARRRADTAVRAIADALAGV